MRRLAKHATPPVLAANCKAWLEEYLADPSSETARYRYRHPEIKAALRTETGWKCVYCESKIGHNTPGDVEHKVPTSEDATLHFEWSNLTVACSECNRRKSNYFSPEAPFLDPYHDDVEECLLHLGPVVFSQPGHGRAEATIRRLELDSRVRAALFDRKLELLEKARALRENVESAPDALLRALRRAELEHMCTSTAEYSAMILAYLVSCGDGTKGA